MSLLVCREQNWVGLVTGFEAEVADNWLEDDKLSDYRVRVRVYD